MPEAHELDLDKLYRAIGCAISNFCRVEAGLGLIFSRVMQARSSRVAEAAFYSVQSFSDKLKMTNNAAQSSLVLAGRITQWDALCKRCQSASELRNKLAHFEVVQRSVNNGPIEVRLEPNFSDFIRIEKSGPKSFNVEQITAWDCSFQQLATTLFELALSLPETHQPSL